MKHKSCKTFDITKSTESVFFKFFLVGVGELQPLSLPLGCTCNSQVFSREIFLYEVI